MTVADGPPRRAAPRIALAAALAWLGCGGAAQAPPEGEGGGGTAAAVDVVVAAPLGRSAAHEVELPATVRAFETAILRSRVSGYLGRMEVDIGDRVRRGQLVATIEIPEIADQLREAEAELLAARAGRAGAEAELERARADRDLREITFERMQAVREQNPDVIAPQTVDEARAGFAAAEAGVKLARSGIAEIESRVSRARALRARLETMTQFAEIRAPFDGVVTERLADPGALVRPSAAPPAGPGVAAVASVGKVRVLVDVPESEAPLVTKRTPAVVRFDSLPGRSFEGTVARYSGALHSAARTMRAEIDIDNRSRELVPGMYGRATLTLASHADAILLPAEAVRAEGGAEFVYLVIDGRARRVGVEAEIGDGIQAQVTKGLAGDEAVILSARGPLADGVRVRSVRARAEGER